MILARGQSWETEGVKRGSISRTIGRSWGVRGDQEETDVERLAVYWSCSSGGIISRVEQSRAERSIR